MLSASQVLSVEEVDRMPNTPAAGMSSRLKQAVFVSYLEIVRRNSATATRVASGFVQNKTPGGQFGPRGY